jgi:catalase
MPEAEAASYRVNPFDVTKVWPYRDYPLIEVGRMVLDRNPENYFAEVEQSAFDPGHFVPGIGPSPDKMLQGRLFAYGDSHRYRLGVNHTRLPINAPRGVATGATNYGRDGAMSFGANGGRAKNYEPNSFNGPAQSGEPLYAGFDAQGVSGSFAPARLVRNIAGSLAQVAHAEIVARSIAHFRSADPVFGARLEAAVKERRR